MTRLNPDPTAFKPDDLIRRLPGQVVVERILATRPSGILVRALVDGVPAAVRLLSALDETVAAEWSALSSIQSDHVARVLAWGELAPLDGSPEARGLWVARQWIEGEPLESYAKRAKPSAITAAVGDIFDALEVVHGAGFVHGDLSPGNVIVDAEGRGHLTDFGMASATAGSETRHRLRRSGTPLFIAPEVLVGGVPSAASDLFSLASVLTLSLVGLDVNPARFYGRFPAEPFLEAADVDLDALPAGTRWTLTTLLSRHPGDRQAGDFRWSQQLQSSARGPHTQPDVIRLRPVSILEGRETTLDQAVAGPHPLHLLTTADDDETRAAVDASAIRLLQRGRQVRCIHAAELAQRGQTTLEVDQLIAAELPQQGATEAAARGARSVLLIAVTRDDTWTLDVLDILVRASVTSGAWVTVLWMAEVRTARLTRSSSPLRGAQRAALPSFTGRLLGAALGARATAPRQSEAWVDALDRLSKGSVSRLNDYLRRAAEEGAFEPGPTRLETGTTSQPVVRSTFRWEALAMLGKGGLPSDLSQPARRTLAALVIHGGTARVHDLARSVPDLHCPPHLDELSRAGLIASRRIGRVSLTDTVPALADFGVPRSELRAIHQESVELSPFTAAPGNEPPLAPDHWVHHLAGATPSNPAPTESVLVAVRELVSRDLHAQVARGLAWSRTVLESEHRALPPPLMGQLALAQARTGEGAAARATARLSGIPSVLDEVDGILAHVAGKLDQSSAAFRRAGRALQGIVEAAHRALERGDHAAFEAFVHEADDLDPAQEKGGARALVDLLSLKATAAARMGDAEQAFCILDDALALASDHGGPLAQANVHINRAGLARAQGALDVSHRELELARELFQAAGSATGEAQAQALAGTLLKDEGQLAAAEQPLRSAIGRRERLGARHAAAMSRGTLGILLNDRGHMRRAIDELQRASQDLRDSGLQATAELVEASLDLAMARIGHSPDAPAGRSAHHTDPRVREWHALASQLRLRHDTSRAETTLVPGHELSDDVALLTRPFTADGAAASIAALAERAQLRATQGRDAVAARLGIEAIVRARQAGSTEDDESMSDLIATALAQVCQGLKSDEVQHLERSLLGFPDPAPHSLESWRQRQDDEMDVMKILDLNERLVRQEDTATLLGAIVEAAIEVSGAERGFIVMSRDGTLALDTAFESSRGDVVDEDVDYSRSIVEEALGSRRTLRVSDALEHDEWSGAQSVENLRLRSILAAPFFVSAQVAGVVVLDDRSRPGAFGPREERLLELLGGQAALAMRQVSRLEENRRLSAELRRRVVTQGAQLQEATRALDRAGVTAPIEGLLGDSSVMEAARAMIHRVARSKIATLITGPSGSGKELAARALHALSDRKDAPFVAENCAALPASLAESELFGVKKGAFTGAESDRAGLFERASGGTLFLDEIGELPLELQAKLLRVLETRTVRRVGEETERAVDFRLVSATNRDLGTESEAGRFRSDLMYRLDGVTVAMPALAERTEDIPALVQHFLSLAATDGSPTPTITAEVMQRLMERPWPGNVRELSNEVSRLHVLSGGDIVNAELVRSPADAQHAGGPGGESSAGSPKRGIRTIAQLEREAIFDALKATGDDKREAAAMLGISRAKIYQRLKEWEEA